MSIRFAEATNLLSVSPTASINAGGLVMAAGQTTQVRNFPTLWNPAAGTTVIEWVQTGSFSLAPGVWCLDDGTANANLSVFMETDGSIRVQRTAAGTRIVWIVLAQISLGATARLALSYGPAGVVASLNRSAPSSAAIAPPSGVNRWLLGLWNPLATDRPMTGSLRALRYLPTQLTGAALLAA